MKKLNLSINPATIIVVFTMLIAFNLLAIELPKKEVIIKNKVKSLTRYEGKFKFGKAEFNPKPNLIVQYDSLGNLIEELKYKSDGGLEESKYCKYDDNGNITEEKEFNSNGVLYRWETTIFNSKGGKIESIDYYNDGSISAKAIYKYLNTGKGTVEEVLRYDSDGCISGKSFSKYNKKGDIIEYSFYGADGSIVCEVTNKYNEQGKINENLTMQGSYEAKTLYKYNRKNLLMSETVCYLTTGAPMAVYKFKYDEQGNLIEKYHLTGRGYIQMCKYDKTGDLIEEISYDGYTLDQLDQLEKIMISDKYDLDLSGKKISSRFQIKYYSIGLISEIISLNNLNEPEEIDKYVYEYYK